ncbi:polyamine-transporting ATPase 13A3-like isoform X1 [Daktulosphaira vitifoliae]|uniref:polyamine-transporting ATPase 13A3-like isoform X1 n=1 Tax=Daktulosphaira vitifoliae TaxID=58002 RepID=UPI0021A9870D|nr:polyamine-transporting ATPase 13A3-like isoform X1 [Daktulosphaira vitifoliae]XP_050530518.1 polyamine-transporting ATPase 13A3-like isoform X1 [Daktulosphaira vitifoliae]
MVLCMGCCSKRDYTLLDGMSSYQPSSNTDFTETIAVKCGYSYNFTKTVIFHIVAVCLLGIPYLAIHWSSNLKLLLLMSKCPLSTADCILVNDMNNYNNIYEIKTSVIKCMKGEQKVVKHFEHQLLKYIWDDRENVFKLLQGLDNGTTTLSKLLDKSHGLTTEEHESQLELFGKNEIVIEVPSYWKLFIVEVLNPFYVFQIFSIGLWFFDEYEIYAVCVLVSSAFSIGTSLYQLKEQSRSLKKTVDTHNCDIYTVLRRNSENIKVKAEYLVPGDVIVIPPGGGNIACDALLLSGNCIVDESLLTGESEPITKSPPSSIEEFCYVSSAHKHHTLYCGTRILQSRFYSGAQVLALVVRTGSSTAKGNLIRSIMFPKEIDFEFYLDSIKFVIIMFIVATIGMGYCAYLYLMRQASLEYIVIRSLDIYTVVVPPALPAAMTIGIVHSLQRLKRHKIYCTCQSRINVSGKIKLVCFDKTGTLTEDGLDFLGVLPFSEDLDISSDISTKLIKDIAELDVRSPLVAAMATCHSLTHIQGCLAGDPLDLSMFNATNWEFEEPGVDSSRFDNLLPSIVRPPKQLDIEDNPVEIGIVHQYPFNSKTQSMCVIGKVFGSRNYTVYCKGAPEKIIQSCLSHTIPSNTFSVLEKFGSLGYRILALAYKNLPKKVNWKNLYHLKLEEVQSNLIFLGFLVMQNKLKPQSRSVISQLRTANIKSVMVTGDNLFTGISVAKESLIIPSLNINLAVVTATPSTEITRGDIKIEPALGNTLSEPMHYAIDGKSWAVLESEFPSWLPQIVTKGLVFGRMLPEQKVKLVEYFQSLGYVTAMCGDGANDAGALKAAHVGISLSQAEASIAAPFTSQVTNVTCVTKVIREGRCALVTSFGIFKYMTCYSLIQFITLVILYSRGIMLGNFQFLYFDFVLTTSLAIVMGDSEPADKVFPHRPLSRILTPKNLIPLFLQILVCALIQQASLFYLTLQNWYIPAIPAWSDDDVIVCWENTTLFFTSAYQYIILALVLNKGQPHRKPFYMNLSFTIVVIILILFTLMLQTIDVSTIKNIFDIVVLDQTHENEQRLFLVTLLAFPVLHFYLAIMIEILGESMLLKICINIVKRKRAPKNIYKQVLNESSNFMSI